MRVDGLARGAWALARTAAGHRAPFRVTHCVTYRCNLDCRHCARHYALDEMGTEEAKSIMKSFLDAGCLFWSFNGGEPLVRDDIGELIRHGKTLGFYQTMATNGTLVPERIDDVSGLDMVSVSLDGGKAAHEKVRPGSFDKAVAGLDCLRERGVKTALTTVVGRHNIDGLGEVLEMAGNYGAKVFFQPIRVQKEDDLAKSRRYFPTREEMREAMDYLIGMKRSHAPVASSISYMKAIRDNWPDGMPNVRCGGGMFYCFITPDGRAAACCDTLSGGSAAGCDARTRGAESFRSIPAHKCATCYSSVPLELNLAYTRPAGALWERATGRA